MDISELISKKIFSKKAGDYTFTVMFFLIFSIFIFFAVRPSLTTAFSLKREEEDLKKINSLYEKKIMEIVTIQSQVEKNRDDFYLLEQALTKYPQLNKILKDIGEVNSFEIEKANIGEVNLIKAKDQSLKKLKVNIEGVGDFTGVLQFIHDLFSQRRLKTIQNMVLTRDLESTQSSQLKISMEVEAYYL